MKDGSSIPITVSHTSSVVAAGLVVVVVSPGEVCLVDCSVMGKVVVGGWAVVMTTEKITYTA